MAARTVKARRFVGVLLSILTTGLLLEIALRVAFRPNAGQRYLFSAPWRFLVPLDPPRIPDPRPKPGAYIRYDANLGWTLGENGSEPPLYYADQRGIRCSKAAHDGGVGAGDASAVDIITLGDSFTHGDEVSFDDSWPELLRARAGVRLLNLGVGGYGVDQAALRFQHSGLQARTVLLGVIAGDFDRAVSSVFQITTGNALQSKPLFRFDPDGAHILNQPAAAGETLRREFEMGEQSALLRMSLDFEPLLFRRDGLDSLYLHRVPKSALAWRRMNKTPAYRSGDERFEHGVKVLLYLRELVEARGGRLTVVFLESEYSIMDRTRLPTPWQPLRDRLAREGIGVIDATEPIALLYGRGRDLAFNRGGLHYTPEANRAVASLLAEELAPQGGSQAAPVQ